MKRVLIVEDECGLRESLQIILEESGFDVDTAEDGKEALDHLKNKVFDAVILDNNLPFIQGEDLLGLIKIHSPEVQIILMSGAFEKETIEQAKLKGVNLVIEKPFDFKIIIQYLNFD